MATDLSNLVDALNLETAKQLTVPDLLDLLRAGVDMLNGHIGRGFEYTGTELDRDATAPERRAIVLCAVVVWLDQKTIEASEIAISHSNVAGKTSLDGIEFALAKRRKELFEQQLGPLLERLKAPGVISEVSAHELGETLDQVPPSAGVITS